MPYVEIGGQRIFYAFHDNDAPSHATMLLIHGAGYHHLVWPAVLRRMPGMRVIAVDLPGHYKSEGEASRSVAEYAGFIVRLLDAMHIEHAVIGGHSMGGAIAQQFAATNPGRVAALILIASAARLNIAVDLLQLIASDQDSAIDRLSQAQWSRATPEQLKRLSRQQMRSISPDALQRDYAACAAFDLRDRLKDIRSPALVIAGDEDNLVPLSESRFLAQHLPNAKLKIIEGAAHMPMLERDIEVARAIETFLRELNLLSFE